MGGRATAAGRSTEFQEAGAVTRFLGFRVVAAMLGAAALTGLGSTGVFAAGKTAPTSPVTVSISSPASGSTQNASFTASGSSATTARRASISSVQVSVDGGAYLAASGATSWSYAASGLATGSHTLTA